MADLSKYYDEVEAMLFALDTALNAVEQKLSQIVDDDIDLLDSDYSGAIASLQKGINGLTIMGNIHKFERITKEQMQYLFSSYDAGIPGRKIIVDRQYTVADYDTTRTIEQRFNMAWEDIQAYNGIVPSQLTANLIIRIPIEIDLSNVGSKDIPVFSDQQGNNVLGTDLPKVLTATATGDLSVLGALDTMQQDMLSYLTTLPGSLQYYEDIGFNPKTSDDYGPDESQSIIQLRAINALMIDPRVSNVDIISAVKKGNNININLSVTAISGDIITVIK